MELVEAAREPGREEGPAAPPLEASYFGVTSPASEETLVVCWPWPLTIPKPGMRGAERDEVEALPLVPKGNFVSKAPERELDDVLGREVEADVGAGAPRPQLALLDMPCEALWAWPVDGAERPGAPGAASCSRSMPESFHGLR